MHNQPTTLRNEARTLLKLLALASQATTDLVTFEYRAVQGYPFGWLLHPGLDDGACVVTTDSLLALTEGGCIECDADPATSAAVRCFLTDQGKAYCSLLLVDVIAHLPDGHAFRVDGA